MDEVVIHLFPSASEVPGACWKLLRASRRRWLRRMLLLMGSASVAFGVTAAWLAHLSDRFSAEQADSQAADLVRGYFSAVQRGDFRSAYLQYSRRYQREIPFDVFHDMVIAHWSLFREKRVVLLPQETTVDRVVLETNFIDSTGTRVVAEFSLVRVNDRWWIDDVRWSRGITEHLTHA
jgi:hypothetical protein